MKIFLSHSFSDDDRDLVQGVERLLKSQNIVVATGRRLAGGQLHPEVRQRIDNSDGLVALKTRRESVGNPEENRWRSSAWIDYEYTYAREQGKHAIAIVEHGVETDGPFESYERIALDQENPLETFLALSETLWQWKERAGIQRIVQIRPDDLGRIFRTNRNLRCRYHFIDYEGNPGEWVYAQPIVQASGILLYLKGVRDDDTFIEVEILHPQDENPRWYSPATAQFISVEMQAWEEGS
jgi:hypothetical protein